MPSAAMPSCGHAGAFMLRSTRIALMIALWAAAIAAPGCATRVFMTERDFRANPGAALDEAVAAEEAKLPSSHAPTGPVTTILDSERKKRPISLPECIALALERGR